MHSLKVLNSVFVVMIPMLLFNTNIVILSLTKCLDSAQNFVVVYFACNW